MRIAHVIDYFHTDVGYQEFYLARAQGAAGHDVSVITSEYRHHTVVTPGADEERGRSELEDVGVRLHRLPGRQLGHDRAWIQGLEAALEKAAPEGIHCHGPFAATTVRTVRWARRNRTSILVDNHIQESGAPGSTTPLGRTFYAGFRFLFGPQLRKAVSSWVADGPEKAEFLSTRLSIPLSEIDLVPLGFDPSLFRFDEGLRLQERATRRWTDDHVVVVTGKLIRSKRVEWVAAAADRIGRQRPTRLVLAGSIEPDYLEEVLAAAPELAGKDRVELLPMLTRQDLAKLYLAADVAAFARLPSISIFEALGTGAKVALGDDPFARWLTHLHPGITSSPGADLDLTPSGNERSILAQEAAGIFSWDEIAADFVRRYRKGP